VRTCLDSFLSVEGTPSEFCLFDLDVGWEIIHFGLLLLLMLLLLMKEVGKRSKMELVDHLLVE
jgi:hypothetical protein